MVFILPWSEWHRGGLIVRSKHDARSIEGIALKLLEHRCPADMLCKGWQSQVEKLVVVSWRLNIPKLLIHADYTAMPEWISCILEEAASYTAESLRKDPGQIFVSSFVCKVGDTIVCCPALK